MGHAFDGFQLEGNFALRIADDTLDEEEATNAYAVGLRGYWVVHETERADFALAAGGSFAFLEPPRGGLDYGGSAVVGARVRIFNVPNVCITGTLGFGASFRPSGSLGLVAARPLGSAGFLYYFR